MLLKPDIASFMYKLETNFAIDTVTLTDTFLKDVFF